MIISYFKKTELHAVVLFIMIALLKTMELSMSDVIIFPLEALSHGINFRSNYTIEQFSVF